MLEEAGDIAALPFMERKHLGEHYPYGLFAVPLKDIVRIHTAPGTSKNPTVSGYARQDVTHWHNMVAHALAAAGVDSRDILQVSLESGLANWGRDYKEGAETLETGVIPNTPLSPEKQLMVLRDYKISVLVTTPSEAAQLAFRMFQAGLNPTNLNLKRLILAGEPVDAAFRAHIEEQLHVDTWLHYGLSEVPGPAIAFECEHRNGLHIHDEHFLPEIIDPQTGQVLPEDETGELVLTTLTTRAFPLIRFRTGDRARLITAPCPCGRPMIRMEWENGRTDSLLNVNGVKVHENQITGALARTLGFTPLCRYYIHREPGERNCLEVAVAVDNRIFSDEIRELEQRLNRLRDTLYENTGVPVRIRLRETGFFQSVPEK